MALGDEQIDRAANAFDEIFNRRLRQLSDIADEKIECLRVLIGSLKVTTEPKVTSNPNPAPKES